MNSQISKFVVHMKSYLQMSKVHAIWFLGTQATHQGALGGPLAFLAIQLKKLILMLFYLILRNPLGSFDQPRNGAILNPLKSLEFLRVI